MIECTSIIPIGQYVLGFPCEFDRKGNEMRTNMGVHYTILMGQVE